MTSVKTELPVPDVPAHAERRRRFQLGALGAGGLIGLGIIVVLGLVVLIGPLFVGDPNLQDTSAVFQPPSWAHPFGTDNLGRDQLARVVDGGRATLFVAFGATTLAAIIGIALGIVGAYNANGRVAAAIDYVADSLLALPALVLIMTVATALSPSLLNLIGALAIVLIPTFIRIAKGQARVVIGLDYMKSGVVAGGSPPYLMLRYILPNVAATLIAYYFLMLSAATLAESALSFLGLGLQPPQASWGFLIRAGAGYVDQAPWMLLFPTLAVTLIVLSYNLVGDGIQRARDRNSEVD
jgi:peptide/nickel transport system permease protein